MSEELGNSILQFYLSMWNKAINCVFVSTSTMHDMMLKEWADHPIVVICCIFILINAFTNHKTRIHFYTSTTDFIAMFVVESSGLLQRCSRLYCRCCRREIPFLNELSAFHGFYSDRVIELDDSSKSFSTSLSQQKQNPQKWQQWKRKCNSLLSIA